MKSKVAIICVMFAIGIVYWLFIASGYEFPNENKHAEIPFFPATTNKNLVNHQVDSMYVESYQVLKKSNLLLINYDKDKRDDQSSSLAIVTKSFKPIFYLKTTDYLYSSFSDSLNVLFIIQNKNGIAEGSAYNLNNRRLAELYPINKQEIKKGQINLKTAKHFTSNGGVTMGVF